MGCHDKELSILFTDDATIADLNHVYLGRQGPTNVLAFPMAEGPSPAIATPMLGDVVISADTAARESEVLAEPFARTINRLLIHGVLHLLGFDHTKSSQEADQMVTEEKRLMNLITNKETF